MSTKDFYQRFGVLFDNDEVRKKFIARTEIAIFKHVEERRYIWKPEFLTWLSEELGERYDFIRYDPPLSYIDRHFKLLHISRNDFLRCLHLIELIYIYAHGKLSSDNVSEKANAKSIVNHINIKIPELIDKSEVNLNILWKTGKFYPAGAKILDQKLVVDVLDWLNDYPEAKGDFDKSLKAYMSGRHEDAVSDCYKCLEGFVRKYLSNSKTLDNNKEELLKKINLSQEWKGFLNSFINYANEYSRHASEKRSKLDPYEVEAFIYLTGLIIRLCINKK